ncbi:MAG: sulfotransferase family protein [Streptosporangiales bacterium]|nr:sulfotransferase family protein [Streptosporangiales bacterium]
MALRVIGAGLPRTGTTSLQAALPRLAGGPCYHMVELGEHPEHLDFWARAGDGVNGDELRAFFADYAAAVDFPASMYWRELAEAFPDAPVLLSKRDSPQAWWRSMDNTILPNVRKALAGELEVSEAAPFARMMRRGFTVFARIANDEQAAVDYYEEHLAEVRAVIAEDRLVEWQPGDGWQPLADMLGVPVPDEEFPHANSADDFATVAGRIHTALTEHAENG